MDEARRPPRNVHQKPVGDEIDRHLVQVALAARVREAGGEVEAQPRGRDGGGDESGRGHGTLGLVVGIGFVQRRAEDGRAQDEQGVGGAVGVEAAEEEALGEVFGVGVGEGEVVEGGFGGGGGGGGGGEEIGVLEGGAVEGAGAEGVEALGDVGVDAGVEGVQVGVCVGGGDVDELAGVRGGEGHVGEGERGEEDGLCDGAEGFLEVDGGGGVDVEGCCGRDLCQLVFRETQPVFLNVAIEDFDLVFLPGGFVDVSW